MWEHRYLYQGRSFSSTASSETFDLPTKGKLAALIFGPKWTNASGGDNSLNLAEVFTKIEVVHRGSEVIKSLSGKQAVGVAWARGLRNHDVQVSHKGTGTQEILIPLLFGQSMYDTEYGLDLSRLENPQFKITYNYAYGTSNDSSGAFSGTAGSFNLELVIAPDDVSYPHYIKTSEVFTWTPSAGTTETVDVPRGHTWPRVYVQCVDNGYYPWNALDQITLNLDTGAKKPVVFEVESLVAHNYNQFKGFRHHSYWGMPNQANILWDPMPGYIIGMEFTTAEAAGKNPMIYGRLQCDRKTIYVTTTNEACEVILKGGMVGNLLVIPFDLPGIQQSLRSADYARVELECRCPSGASSPGTSAVLLEEIV